MTKKPSPSAAPVILWLRDDLRLAERQRPRLVEDDRVYLGQHLQRAAVANEDAALGRVRLRGENRDRR